MAESSSEITMSRSELDIIIQEAVQKAVKAMKIAKDPVGETPSGEAARIEPINIERPEGSKGEKVDNIQAQIDELGKLLKKQLKEDKDAAFVNLSTFPKVKLPPKFKMPEFERFNGIGDPKAHLRHYVGLMRVSELEEDAIVQLFPLSLTGLASTWYYTLEENNTKEWGVLAEKFIQQYAYNTEMEVTKEELKETTQGDKETFSAFVKRWKEKAAKMLKRPSDEEQNAIVLGCLNSRYYNAMYMIPTKVPFTQFYQQGLQIEEGIKSNKIIFNEPTPTTSGWRRNDYGVQ